MLDRNIPCNLPSSTLSNAGIGTNPLPEHVQNMFTSPSTIDLVQPAQTHGYTIYENPPMVSTPTGETLNPLALTKPEEIIKMLREITKRLNKLDQKTKNHSLQLDHIMNSLQGKRINPSIGGDFLFQAIANEKELEELEAKLEDEEFKSEFINWLLFNVDGDCAENRMLSALDMIFSLEFQACCTWTGSSRKGPKIAMMPNRRILSIFQRIGHTETETVTQQKLAVFFKKKLKNAFKRLSNTGQRRGSRHVRRHKKPTVVEQGTQNTNYESDSTDVSCEGYGNLDDQLNVSEPVSCDNSFLKQEQDITFFTTTNAD
ncbi:uncharacterized protein LOC129740083 isoform X2 [Uranotaenia lowii]|nr:uncharacterized protein LOC129740083 isoform X2 [Uranotaenia lowii]